MTVRYLTPHSKWSIHSEYQDNLFMLSLSRGGPTIWLSPQDAVAIGVADNDWMECVNANGVLVGRAIVSYRMPEGVVYVHHAQERIIDVPKSEATGRRGGIPQLGDPLAGEAEPPDRRIRPVVVHVQLPRSNGQPAGHRLHHPASLPGGAVRVCAARASRGIRRRRRRSQRKNASARSSSVRRRAVYRRSQRDALLAHRAWNPPPSSSLAEEERLRSLLLRAAARDSATLAARYDRSAD